MGHHQRRHLFMAIDRATRWGYIATRLARRYNRAEDLDPALLRYVWLYNPHLHQESPSPSFPDFGFFIKPPSHRTEPDIPVSLNDCTLQPPTNVGPLGGRQ